MPSNSLVEIRCDFFMFMVANSDNLVFTNLSFLILTNL